MVPSGARPSEAVSRTARTSICAVAIDTPLRSMRRLSVHWVFFEIGWAHSRSAMADRTPSS